MRNRYKDDYRETYRLNGRGQRVREYEYVGRFYVLPFDGEQKRKTARVNFLYAAGLTAVQVAAGMLNPDSSRTFWIVYPYLFLYLPLFYAFFGVYAYAQAPVRMQSAQYHNGLMRIRRSFMGVLVLSAANIAADIVYMVLYHDRIRMVTELVYCLMFVILIAAVVCYGRFYDRTYAGITVE